MNKERDYYVSPDNERCGYEWDLGILTNQYMAGVITANEYAVELNKMLYDMHEMISSEINEAEEEEEDSLDKIAELKDDVWNLENDKDDLETEVEELKELLKEIKEISQSHVSKSINNGVTPVKAICRINDTIMDWERENYETL